MRGPAQQPGEVLDRGVVAVHRIRKCPSPCRRTGGGRVASPAAPAMSPIPEDAQIISPRSRSSASLQITDLATRSMVREAINPGELRGHGPKVDSGLPTASGSPRVGGQPQRPGDQPVGVCTHDGQR